MIKKMYTMRMLAVAVLLSATTPPAQAVSVEDISVEHVAIVAVMVVGAYCVFGVTTFVNSVLDPYPSRNDLPRWPHCLTRQKYQLSQKRLKSTSDSNFELDKIEEVVPANATINHQDHAAAANHHNDNSNRS